jgi:D-xylose transport system ATP-binding protein
MSISESRPSDDWTGATTPGSDGTLLELRKITKTFGPVRALTDVDLQIPAGKVTALVGDNGAGKSSLIKTVSGLWGPDGGEILWEGHRLHLHGPRDAEALGITTIYQDLALCDNLDIVQNMFLGRERGKSWLLDEADMEQAARRTLASLSVRTVTSVRMPVASLSGGQRQTVAIARSLLTEPKLILLDEPTAALGVAQTAEVLDLVERVRARGLGVIMISHNMEDVRAVADRIVVLRLGRNNGEFEPDASNQDLVTAITGADENSVSRRASRRRAHQSPEQRR